jgi:hypothetical protein
MKQTKPFYVKLKRLAIYGHAPNSTIRELIIYDQLPTLRYNTGRYSFVA